MKTNSALKMDVWISLIGGFLCLVVGIFLIVGSSDSKFEKWGYIIFGIGGMFLGIFYSAYTKRYYQG